MRTSGAGRVLMFSQRNLYELEVWRSVLREFEELHEGLVEVRLRPELALRERRTDQPGDPRSVRLYAAVDRCLGVAALPQGSGEMYRRAERRAEIGGSPSRAREHGARGQDLLRV